MAVPNRREVSDEALMRLVQRSDLEAFERLFERHCAAALRIACAICRHPATAEDAVQEAFLELWRDRDSYRPEAGSFKGWAFTVVRHRATDAVRREAVRPRRVASHDVPTEDMPDPRSPTPDDTVIGREEADALRASIGRLPEEQAEVIALAFFGQLSHTEIAERLAIPPGTVKGRIRLGLEKLRTQLELDRWGLPTPRAPLR